MRNNDVVLILILLEMRLLAFGYRMERETSLFCLNPYSTGNEVVGATKSFVLKINELGF